MEYFNQWRRVVCADEGCDKGCTLHKNRNEMLSKEVSMSGY